ALVSPLTLAAAEDAETPIVTRHRMVTVEGADGPVGSFERNGHVSRLYGRPMSHGATPEASVDAFLAGNAEALGLAAQDLVPSTRPGGHLQPIFYERDADRYRFTGVYFDQVRGGLPVFRSQLVLLVRNEPGFPLVLANPATSRDLGDFQPGLVAGPAPGVGAVATGRFGPDAEILSARAVIYAGVDDEHLAPRVADEVMVGIDFDKWLIVTDHATGAILYEEHLIRFADIDGTVEGSATEGVGAEQCEDEVPMGLPYLQVSGDGESTFTDEFGDYVLTGVTGGVTVTAGMNGFWFDVDNWAGAETSESDTGTAPGTIDLLLNASNTDPLVRAQVNGYLYSNLIRDFVLVYNPDFPNLDAQNFPVIVNRTDGFCPGNAWYDPGEQSINFCQAGGSAPNTAWSSVVYHEYGHHLVAMAGSGQGAYGEGSGDTMSTLILDDADLGVGFFGSCASALRDADNGIQFPCSGGSHTCGQLLSGCVWETRNELVSTNPDTYIDIVSNLFINSMLLHTGTSIDPSITIDFLTLDDDNGDILDGTPHYTEIATGFGEHSMDAPELALIGFEFPDGLPSVVDPGGTTTLRVIVSALAADPEPGSAVLLVQDGVGFSSFPMTEVEPNVYDATFPAMDCGTSFQYYFKALTTDEAAVFWPIGAPTETFVTAAADALNVVIDDDFEFDLGWTVENIALDDGPWERGVPAGDGDRGDPLFDFDGSGAAYLTDNVAGNSDVDGGPTRLISPVMELAGTDPIIEYARWFTNDDLDIDRLDVHVSNDGGASWMLVESVPHAGEVWVSRSFRLLDFVTATDEVQLRFSATDQPNDSVTEAGIDAVKVIELVCSDVCVGDLDGTGDVGFSDLLAVIAAWGPCPGCPADLDGSGDVGFSDLLTVIAAWGTCP
ncbi:MAG: hypothetical protein KJO43_09250, partial [Phycisphaerae bacterium]|nr:hypothetical protein [Phycisphaerae bacterium]